MTEKNVKFQIEADFTNNSCDCRAHPLHCEPVKHRTVHLVPHWHGDLGPSLHQDG